MNLDGRRAVIEALLFSNDKPVLIEQIKNIFADVTPVEIRSMLEELKAEYEKNNRGMRVIEIAGGFQMVTAPDFASHLKKFYKQKHTDKFSKPALESLAIIAYKQPVTRLEIESIRGVKVDGVVRHLQQLGIIRISGRKKVPGRPFVYSTTREFLQYFGLKSLNELPKMEDFSQLASSQISESENNQPAGGEDES